MGFGACFEDWLSSLETSEGLNPFLRLRAEQMSEIATSFDREGNGDIETLIETLNSYELKEATSSSAVEIMTIHKAKGLDFDAVILPDLDGDALGVRERGGGLLVGRSEQKRIRWVIEGAPPRLAELDPVQKQQREENRFDEIYEGFCRLYVAMTRPKYALYMVMDGQSKKSENSANPACWLRSTLEKTLSSSEPPPGAEGEWRVALPIFCCGAKDWFETYGERES